MILDIYLLSNNVYQINATIILLLDKQQLMYGLEIHELLKRHIRTWVLPKDVTKCEKNEGGITIKEAQGFLKGSSKLAIPANLCETVKTVLQQGQEAMIQIPLARLQEEFVFNWLLNNKCVNDNNGWCQPLHTIFVITSTMLISLCVTNPMKEFVLHWIEFAKIVKFLMKCVDWPPC